MNKVDVWENVTANVLFEKIIPSHKPAILKGLVNNWPVIKYSKKSYQHLYNYLNEQTINSKTLVTTFEGSKLIKGRYFYLDNIKEFNFNKNKQSFSNALRHIYNLSLNNEEELTVYTGSVEVSPHLKNFKCENKLPFAMGVNIEPRVWLGNSSTVSTHFDETNNIACLVSGERRFTLFPTEQVKNLYPGPLNNTVAGAPMSMVNVDEPDFNKHPRYKEALKHALVADLEVGDAIYIPPLWWHNVRSKGDFCMLVNYFWNYDNRKLESPINALLHGLYTLSHLSDEERSNWKHLIDHFVFKVHGEPVGHLPEGERGIFDQITPDHAYDIRDIMLRNMGFELENIAKGKYSLKIK